MKVSERECHCVKLLVMVGAVSLVGIRVPFGNLQLESFFLSRSIKDLLGRWLDCRKGVERLPLNDALLATLPTSCWVAVTAVATPPMCVNRQKQNLIWRE